MLLLLSLGLFDRAGPLLVKSNKFFRFVGHRSNPQGALIQAAWVAAEEEGGTIWPDSGYIHHGEVPPTDAPGGCR